jgi:hypothetical protein
MQLKFDSIRIGVVLYSILSSNSTHSCWHSNLCFYTIHWVETEEFQQDANSRLLFVMQRNLELASGSIVQILSWNWSFVDSLIDQFDHIRWVWWNSIRTVKLCFSIQIEFLLKRLALFYTNLTSNYYPQIVPRLYESLDLGLYKYGTSKNHDSCPLWSPIGALFSRSSHSSCLVLLVMKVCVES